jgi:hypothetical protein
VTELEEFLRRVVSDIESAEIPYMVVGSVAAAAHGNPRSTHDVDIVIAPSTQQLTIVVQRFQYDLYADLTSAQSAMSTSSMFNIIDFNKGLKADLIFLKQRPFDQIEFSRRQKIKALGALVWAASAEDIILSKLEWSRLGDSERQYRDAFAVAAMQLDSIDRNYLQRWAVELEVDGLLNRLFKELATTPRIVSPHEHAD